MVMNSVSCCGVKGCIDVYDPVKVKRLQEWAESDARFLIKLSMKKDNDHQTKMMMKSDQEEGLGYFRLVSSSSERSLETPDRFAVRQRYLRSYTFVKEEEENSKESTKKKIINKLILKNKKINNNNNNNNIKAAGKKIEGTCSSLVRHCFKFMLSCVAQVDVHA
ncbi:hypothetical protein Ddye_010368 [Dipteronia dyeriana]|uniref:Uncharacterized protein n=1 Tax=Dipteronia dyeriana TaxID=168575 RepID=A0AAD9XD47_9ROSI|nr:hypothetical protein Ddye_010368 [Dipteronia dyeriana]